MTQFSKNIKQLRVDEKLSQKDFAEKLRTTQRKISYWENGKVEPSLNDLITISNLISVSIDDLIK